MGKQHESAQDAATWNFIPNTYATSYLKDLL